MTMRNVGIVFSPTLNIPTPVLSMFLTEFDAVFGENHELTIIPPLEVAVSESLTPDDLRSPRRQMFSDIPTPHCPQNTFSTSSSRLLHSHGQASSGHLIDASDTAFIPLQPTYEISTPQAQQSSVTALGPEYARVRNIPVGGVAKARRRESSMLLMGPGQRKGSLPMLTGGDGRPSTFQE